MGRGLSRGLGDVTPGLRGRPGELQIQRVAPSSALDHLRRLSYEKAAEFRRSLERDEASGLSGLGPSSRTIFSDLQNLHAQYSQEVDRVQAAFGLSDEFLSALTSDHLNKRDDQDFVEASSVPLPLSV